MIIRNFKFIHTILKKIFSINFITHCLAYHDHGTHGIRNNNGIYDIRYLPTSDDVKAILIVTNRYYLDIDKISNYNTSVSQVHIDTFNELVVLNWFLKHTGSLIESWENEQKNIGMVGTLLKKQYATGRQKCLMKIL